MLAYYHAIMASMFKGCFPCLHPNLHIKTNASLHGLLFIGYIQGMQVFHVD